MNINKKLEAIIENRRKYSIKNNELTQIDIDLKEIVRDIEIRDLERFPKSYRLETSYNAKKLSFFTVTYNVDEYEDDNLFLSLLIEIDGLYNNYNISHYIFDERDKNQNREHEEWRYEFITEFALPEDFNFSKFADEVSESKLHLGLLEAPKEDK